jgi:exosortase
MPSVTVADVERAAAPKFTHPLWQGTMPWAILLAALSTLLYYPLVPELVSDWATNPGASQGFLLPPFAFYIAWMRRRSTLAIPVSPESRGLLLIALACLLFLVGKLSAEFFAMRVSMVILLAGLIWTFWGLQRLRTLIFPLLLLAAMIPLPVLVYNSLAAPLQLLASEIATDVAQFFGVSIYRDGNIIHLAGASLGVAEACSGLESLSALMVAALLLGFLNVSSVAGRVFLFGISVPLAIAVNVMRVAGTALLADYRPEWAMGFYHMFSGWLVFLAGFGMLWALGMGIHACLDRNVRTPYGGR